jgi:hypothetical protein
MPPSIRRSAGVHISVASQTPSARTAVCATRRFSRPSASANAGTYSRKNAQWVSRHCASSNLPNDQAVIAAKAITSGPLWPVNTAAMTAPMATSIAPAGQSPGR